MAGFDRRALLGLAAAMTTAQILPAWADPVFRRDPFGLGVASGDPLSDGVVLWTRLAPDPLEPGSGMPMQRVEVTWEVASDERFRSIVKTGKDWARPELGHAIHAEVSGLEPGSDYWYRFTVGRERSIAGRTRTAPAAGATVDRFRLGVMGCQNYEHGYFTALRHAAAERFDAIFFYGDYIYEGRESGPTSGRPRRHQGDELYTLSDYRRRYAQYKLDRDLQAAHVSAPWICSFDDHEIKNNWSADYDENGTPPEIFLLRRAAALQAWYENMPVRRALFPTGGGLLAHRRFSFGSLLDLHVLDTRQYRSAPACGGGIGPRCPEAGDPARTILGETQRRWLFDGLAKSTARWNAIAQQVAIGQRNIAPRGPSLYDHDKWDGYIADRAALIAAVAARGKGDVVVLSGDLHNSWIGDLARDFDDPASPAIASEFVGTSISSRGDGADQRPDTPQILAKNPHWKFYSDRRGYLSCTVTPDLWRTDLRVVPVVSKPDAPVSTRASFVVERGKPGVVAV